ncbi:MAG: hypothetical protein FWC40_07950, partial [Proteobacteria bacterium]|nr:hypothetical protein [Pseudomonadota bacterium]
MKRLGWLVAFLSLCASGTGCQDDAVSGDKRPERCSVQGETKCSTSGQLLVCDGNVFVAQSCGAGAICHAGACKAQCNANVFVPTCIQGVQRACVGGVVEERVCVEGEVCQAGACVDESALSCDATYVPRCKDDSTWSACVEGKVRESSCAENQYCFDGRCLNNVPCEEGTFSGRCATGTTMVVCRDGSERLVNCQSNQICLDGACVSDTSCNASFVDTCSADGLRIYCDGGTIRREPCPSGMACDGGMCIERVPCGEDFKDICVEGERVYCDAYGFVVTEKCPGNLKCLYGVCVSDAPCDAATYTPKCQGELFTSACVNKVEVSVECQNGQRCYGGLCQSRPSCVAGTAAICLDAHTRRDCVDGVVLDSLCDFANEVCYQGRCVNKSTVETCGAGFESYCNASEAVFCMHGLVQREVCSADQRCVDGACRKIIKPGDDCDETFVTQCLDETASAFCVGGKVQSVPCGDKVCISGACQARPCNAATFAPRCNGDFAQVVCVSGSEQVLACGTNKFCQDGLCKDSVTIGDVCNPETFVTSCHESGARLTCETKDGASTVVGTACVSPTFCLSGDCVECNSATYGKQCVDGKATTCSGGKLVQVTCGSGETCVAGECVECDVATYVS